MKGRYEWIDSQFTSAPTISHDGGIVSAGVIVTLNGPPNATIYYTLDGTDPRASRGGVASCATLYQGPVAIDRNARLIARARKSGSWNDTWSGPANTLFLIKTPPLALTELMYHPALPPEDSPFAVTDFEFIELRNTGTQPLDLTNFKFTDGVSFVFPANIVLPAGQYVLVVKNRAAFDSRLGTNALIAGEFSGILDNAGERLALIGSVGEPIFDFTYDNAWAPITDGHGFSLVSESDGFGQVDYADRRSWRSSARFGGSPGQADSPPLSFPPVLINEVLSHTERPLEDAVELFNAGSVAADVSGWFLTDDFARPKKFRIPEATMIPAYGFIAFDEHNFNLPDDPASFSFSDDGDEVYLFSADASGNLTGYIHGFRFGAAETNVSFGRHLTSRGEEHLVAERERTLLEPNAGLRVGPLVISEVMYHPPALSAFENTQDEYIELHNITGAPVNLFSPSNSWGLRDAVSFDLAGVTVPAGGYVIVVSFDPQRYPAQLAAFRARYGVESETQFVGPFTGQLGDNGETVELVKPGDWDPASETFLEIVVDQVRYSNSSPWPIAADGPGPSLQRLTAASYGNDPTNWTAASPTPGTLWEPAIAPMITSQPDGLTVLEEVNVNFSATASGDALKFQWRFNGAILLGATNSTLTLRNVTVAQTGNYQLVAYNGGGAAVSANAALLVRGLPLILIQPVSQTVLSGINAAFSVVATFTGAFAYQWQFNGVDIPGATNPSLLLTNVQLANDGIYRVRLTDQVGTRTGSALI